MSSCPIFRIFAFSIALLTTLCVHAVDHIIKFGPYGLQESMTAATSDVVDPLASISSRKAVVSISTDELKDLGILGQITAGTITCTLKVIHVDTTKYINTFNLAEIAGTGTSSMYHVFDLPLYTDECGISLGTSEYMFTWTSAPAILTTIPVEVQAVITYDQKYVGRIAPVLTYSEPNGLAWPFSNEDAKAERYQLDWVYYPTDAVVPGTINDKIDATNAFTYQEPVTVFIEAQESYTFFDNKYPYNGKVYFRVRSAHKDYVGLCVPHTTTYASPIATGPWSNILPVDVVVTTTYDKSQAKQSWTYSAAYSENGKRASITSYYDGSGRLRQQLSSSFYGSDPVTMVSETKYDAEGRQAVQTLPAPIDGKVFAYQTLFNIEDTNDPDKEFNFNDFESSSRKFKMSANSGAGKYYATATDPGSLDELSRFVPVADGLPYMLTTYTDDNTGRIKSTTAAGSELGPDEGHNTQFAYGNPTSTDLQMLFGQQAGDPNHYTKTTSIDPNGQASVTYSDLAGRTVATALTGVVPSNLHPEGSVPTEISDDLSESNQLDLVNRQSTTYFDVVSDGVKKYRFNYDLTGTSIDFKYTDPNGGTSTNISIPCKYDLEIYVILASDLSNIPGTEVNKEVKIHANSLPTFLANPDDRRIITTQSVSSITGLTFDVTLPKGYYKVVKRLKLNLDGEVNRIMSENAAVKAEYDKITASTVTLAPDAEPLDLFNCSYTPEQQCIAAVIEHDKQLKSEGKPYKGFADYYTKYNEWTATLQSAFNTELQNCLNGTTVNEFNYSAEYPQVTTRAMVEQMKQDAPADGCGAMLRGMLEDVTYRPAVPTPENPNPGLLDNSGFMLKESTFWDNAIALIDAADDNCNVHIDGTKLSVSIIDLLKTDISTNWKPEYAEELVKAHREYYQYRHCVLKSRSTAYDMAMSEKYADFDIMKDPNEAPVTISDVWADAKSKGYINPTGMPAIPNQIITSSRIDDPFVGFALKNDLDAKLNERLIRYSQNPVPESDGEWISIWEFTSTTLFSPFTIENPSQEIIDAKNALLNGYGNIGLQKWKLFSSLYTQLKTDIMQEEFNKCHEPYYITVTDKTPIYVTEPEAMPTTPAEVQAASDNAAAEQFTFADYQKALEVNLRVWAQNYINSNPACFGNVGTGDFSNVSTNFTEKIAKFATEGTVFFSADPRWGYDKNPLGKLTNDMLDGYYTNWANAKSYITLCNPTVNPINVDEQAQRYVDYAESILSRQVENCGLTITEQQRTAAVHAIALAINTYSQSAYGSASLGSASSAVPSLQGTAIYYSPLFPAGYLDYEVFHQLIADGVVPACPAGNNYSPVEHQNPFAAEELNVFELNGYYLGFAEVINYAVQTCGFKFQQDDIHVNYYEFLHYKTLDVPNNPFLYSKYKTYISFIDDICIFNKGYNGCLFFERNKGICANGPNTGATGNFPFMTYHYFINSFPSNDYHVTPFFNTITGKIDFDNLKKCYFEVEKSEIQNTSIWKVYFIAEYYNKPSIKTFVYSTENELSTGIPSISGYYSPCSGTTEPPIYTIKKYTYPSPDFTKLKSSVPVGKSMDDLSAECRNFADELATHKKDMIVLKKKTEFRTQLRKAISEQWHTKGYKETFKVKHSDVPYLYTLYYYDQAGQLVQTVPPAGVNELKPDPITKEISKTVDPVHTMCTRYKYNGQNQNIFTVTPDAGITKNWYNPAGQLKVSQNAMLVPEDKYTYYTYDKQGRLDGSSDIKYNSISARIFDNKYYTFRSNEGTEYFNGTSINYWNYSNSRLDGTGFKQRNIRNRVWSTSSNTYNHYINSNPVLYTYYSYDIYGNVESMLIDNEMVGKEFPDERFKTIDYKYDLLSGNVTQVWYQRGKADQFVHKYTYDANNRLITAETSYDGLDWMLEAKYRYYKHGPLANVVLGNSVQSADYTYTINGWLKGINNMNIKGTVDESLMKDAFGLELSYFSGDYTAAAKGINDGTVVRTDGLLGTDALPADAESHLNPNSKVQDQFNGNISGMNIGMHLKPSGGTAITAWSPIRYQYEYDQLSRLRFMDGYIDASYKFNSSVYTYDKNGNIATLRRTQQGASFDNLSYKYSDNTNRLASITEYGKVGAAETFNGLDKNKYGYQYDASGNVTMNAYLTTDANNIEVKNPIDKITWNSKSKIDSVITENYTIYYYYDAAGQRVLQKKRTGTVYEYEYYVRGAAGQIMATYTQRTKPGESGFKTEFVLYGAARLGTASPGTAGQHRTGLRRYELTDHLASVRATVSDRRTTKGALPTIISATDYYPYGMAIKSRSNALDNNDEEKYRFGFGGQQKSTEINAQGNSYTAQFWQYDARIGRRWNVDPIVKPWESSYATFHGNPILVIDPYGDDGTTTIDKEGIPRYSGEVTNSNGEIFNVDGYTNEMCIEKGYVTLWGTGTTNTSDLGGDKVDFTFMADNRIKITSRESGNSVFMKSSKNLEGYTQRENGINWNTIYQEFLNGTGPENSIITAPGMLQDIIKSPQFSDAWNYYKEKGYPKTRAYAASFGVDGAYKAGDNMTAQMIGKSAYSFYNLGDKLVITIMDSKTIQSYSLNPLMKIVPENWINKERGGSIVPQGTTRQTYLMIFDIKK